MSTQKRILVAFLLAALLPAPAISQDLTGARAVVEGTIGELNAFAQALESQVTAGGQSFESRAITCSPTLTPPTGHCKTLATGDSGQLVYFFFLDPEPSNSTLLYTTWLSQQRTHQASRTFSLSFDTKIDEPTCSPTPAGCAKFIGCPPHMCSTSRTACQPC